MADTAETKLAVVEEQVKELRTWKSEFSAELYRRIADMEAAIRKEIAGRPSWGTTIVIIVLSNLVVALGQNFLMKGG